MDLNWYNKLNKGRCIYRSPQNIEVYQNSKFIWIQFNALFIQSMIVKKKPHHPILPYLNHFLLFTKLTPGPICLLGLGGGCVVHILRPLLDQHSLTAVEIHEDMIHIAKQFFKLPEHQNLNIICNSAENFMSQNQKKYKHLLIDLGNATGFPKECRTTLFIEHCYAALEEGGILMMNLTHYSDISFFKPIIQSIFRQNPLIIEADGNWILSVNKNSTKKILINMLKNSGFLKSFYWHSGLGEMISLHNNWIGKIKYFINKFIKTNRI